MPLILIVDDEKNMRRVIAAHLEREGFDCLEAESGERAVEVLAEESPDCVLTDLRMPGMDGMELLRHLSATRAGTPVVMLTAHGTVQTAVEAMKVGAFDYLTKPFDKSELVAIVQKAVRSRDLDRREPAATAGDELVVDGGDSPSRNPQMKALFALVDRVAKSPTTVLITGESGTGKEVIARRLVERSDRAAAPYIRVNCAAIPASLVESELFGHEKGAFTGAVAGKPGRFELADKGTLFLDEIGSIPLETQVKLLRAIQEQEFERVGGVRTLRVDVRLVAATNVDLREEVAAGRFREDLYYRLNVVHLRLPPLRERMEDLDTLVETFVARFNRRLGRKVRGVDTEVWARLRAHPWHGNIRELENTIERAVLLAEEDVIRVGDLPEELSVRTKTIAPLANTSGDSLDLKDASRDAAARVEIEMIGAALRRTGGNVTQAAKLLGLSRKGLQIKMKDYGLERQSGD
ncbi:MAG: sigma-54-dependent Fis family transcriptional regulator [Deltaproteobacteria bacterium]|nr:sigma-54-dependent Fis family transcriptional regulator [Deltaproteobacteria bacterium]